MTHPTDLIALLTLLMLLAVSAAAAAVWIMRRAASPIIPEGQPEKTVYRDQLAELDRDLAEGRISPEALQSARLEIGRRVAVLANASRRTEFKPLGRRTLVGLAASVALLAGGLYWATGTPTYRDQPFATRRDALLARPATSLNDQELIVLLQADAQKNPKDPRPHLFLGQILVAQGRDPDAIRAFQAALRRAPNTKDALIGAGEALVRLSDGKVSAEAANAFEGARLLDGNGVVANFYLALAQWQAGDQQRALVQWQELWDALPTDSEDRRELAARTAQALSALDRGPGAAAAMAGGTMTEAERGAFIASMLQAREQRLAANPRDLSLRLSLARATVLAGERRNAKVVLDAGKAIYAGQAFETAVLDAAVGGLLGPPQSPLSTPAP